jgi:hypothetical protein
MKKLLGIMVLGLFVFSNSFAEKINVKKKVKLPKDVSIGYENPWSLSCTWTEDGKCMTPKYALQIVNKKDNYPVRFGKKSIRMELRKGDCHQKRKGSYNDCKATPPAERHELGSRNDILGKRWHTYSIFLPKDTPIINSEWITMGQFHVINGDYPPVNLDLEGKHFLLVTRFLCVHKKKIGKSCSDMDIENRKIQILNKSELFGKWNDFVFNANWTDDSKKGYFKLWVNGNLVYHFKGNTVGSKDAAIHQLGIYRGAAKSSGEAIHVVYYDEIKTASSCKKLKLKNLGYSCKDLESQKLEKIHTIK